LIKCPFCAEDIQDKAIKCKHCGEWLSESSGTPPAEDNETSKSLDEPLDISASIAKEEKNAVEPSAADESEVGNDTTEIIYSPLHQIPKWGWGWFIILALIVPGFKKMGGVSQSAQAMSYVFNLTIPIVLLTLYFWNRRRIIRKNKYVTKVWHLSFKAGFETYIVALIVVASAYYFVHAQDRKDNNIFFAQLQHKVETIKNDEIKINEIIANSPEIDKWSSQTVNELKKYLQLIDKKRELSKELFDYADKYGAALKDNDIITNSEKIRSVSSELFQKHEDSINSLISYYSTGDEKLYNRYTKLTSEATTLENEYKLLSGNLIKKIQF